MAIDDLTIHERLTIQMEYVVPLVRDLQAILGEDVVNRALEERIRRDVEKAKREPTPDVDLRVMAAGTETYAAGDVLGYEVLEASEDRFEMNVTRCGYKETMERLGGLLPMALRAGTELTRTQTCMQGGSHCDFRYRKRS